MGSKLVPAVVGGLVVGFLSSIPFINYCCCLWAIGGGMLAAYMYIQKSPTPITVGDGAILGILAGLIGGFIYLIIGLPIAYFISAAQLEQAMEQMRQSGIELPLTGIALLLVSGLIGAAILAVLSLIGGMIGVAAFEKRKGAAPPPPNFGAQPGGGFR
jgi:uncharacterized membrane protein required for colicin V production